MSIFSNFVFGFKKSVKTWTKFHEESNKLMPKFVRKQERTRIEMIVLKNITVSMVTEIGWFWQGNSQFGQRTQNKDPRNQPVYFRSNFFLTYAASEVEPRAWHAVWTLNYISPAPEILILTTVTLTTGHEEMNYYAKNDFGSKLLFKCRLVHVHACMRECVHVCDWFNITPYNKTNFIWTEDICRRNGFTT